MRRPVCIRTISPGEVFTEVRSQRRSSPLAPPVSIRAARSSQPWNLALPPPPGLSGGFRSFQPGRVLCLQPKPKFPRPPEASVRDSASLESSDRPKARSRPGPTLLVSRDGRDLAKGPPEDKIAPSLGFDPGLECPLGGLLASPSSPSSVATFCREAQVAPLLRGSGSPRRRRSARRSRGGPAGCR